MANKLVMAYWDCPFCGNKGNMGSATSCPSCGRARGDVRFYMKDNAQESSREADERGDIEYVSSEKAENINRNSDWYCPYCNSLNHDDLQACATCGASRSASKEDYHDVQKKLQAREAAKPQPAKPAQPQKKSPVLKIFALILVAIIAFTVFMNGKKTDGWNVSAMAWQRVITVEENKECSESDWNLPSDATLVEKRSQIRSYRQVLDHYQSVEVQRSRRVFDHTETYYTYQDLGNGYYEEVPNTRDVYRTDYYTETEQQPVYRQDPVYDTRYYYTIWRWTPTRDVTAAAADNHPYWPEVTLSANEREGDRTEAYSITVTMKDKTQTWYLHEADWSKLETGSNIYITATRAGGNPCITDAKGNTIANLYRDARLHN